MFVFLGHSKIQCACVTLCRGVLAQCMLVLFGNSTTAMTSKSSYGINVSQKVLYEVSRVLIHSFLKIRNKLNFGPEIVSYKLGYYFRNQDLIFLNMYFLHARRNCKSSNIEKTPKNISRYFKRRFLTTVLL